jgi:hypothetical protein
MAVGLWSGSLEHSNSDNGIIKDSNKVISHSKAILSKVCSEIRKGIEIVNNRRDWIFGALETS